MKYQKATLNAKTLETLIELSRMWVREGCCFGMRENTREDIKEPCYLAIEGGRIVGYGFGHFYENRTLVGTIKPGDACFEIDEIYVLPSYRSKGVGRNLFALLQEEAEGKAQYITLSSSSKDYARMLKFYVEDNQMVFHSAFLMKKLG